MKYYLSVENIKIVYLWTSIRAEKFLSLFFLFLLHSRYFTPLHSSVLSFERNVFQVLVVSWFRRLTAVGFTIRQPFLTSPSKSCAVTHIPICVGSLFAHNSCSLRISLKLSTNKHMNMYASFNFKSEITSFIYQ